MIRFAKERDIPKILDLLLQVCLVHHRARPDIFNVGTKYNEGELREIFRDEKRPILVSVNEEDEVLGYCFCILQEHKGDNVLTDIKTLYIDDLCVDENIRGGGIGRALYEAARELAQKLGCHNVTLNVWRGNDGAEKFYEKLGLRPQKTCMEEIL